MKINILVNREIFFLKYEMIDEIVEEVSEENAVNVMNYKIVDFQRTRELQLIFIQKDLIRLSLTCFVTS
ncbi:hypothetical protein CR513_22886, partial [Mucuna pruriens]